MYDTGPLNRKQVVSDRIVQKLPLHNTANNCTPLTTSCNSCTPTNCLLIDLNVFPYLEGNKGLPDMCCNPQLPTYHVYETKWRDFHFVEKQIN